jgi:hypothetical protein
MASSSKNADDDDIGTAVERVEDKRKARFLKSVHGDAVYRVPFAVLRSHAMEASSTDFDCAKAVIATAGDDLKMLQLVATKNIKKGQVITLLQPSFVTAVSHPIVPVAKIEDAPQPLDNKSAEFDRAVRAAMYNSYACGGHGMCVIVETLNICVLTKIEPSVVKELNKNSSYLGSIVGEPPAFSVDIQKAVMSFVHKHAIEKEIDGKKQKNLAFTPEEATDLLATFTILSKQHGHLRNAEVKSMQEICVPCIVATADIPKGSPIYQRINFSAWLCLIMTEQAFGIAAIQDCLSTLLKIEASAEFPEQMKKAVASLAKLSMPPASFRGETVE